MLMVCGWCKKELGPVGDTGEHRVSHGLCASCESHLMASVDGIPLRQFLDSLDVPITLVDDDLRIEYANTAAQALLNKPFTAIEHRLGGEVFECENSYKPGGCGHTVKCSACSLRNAVNRCFESSNAEYSVVTNLTQRTEAGTAELAMRISTQRVNGQVLVTINEVTR
jgi:hypothetical protein